MPMCANCGMTLLDGEFACPACQERRHQADMRKQSDAIKHRAEKDQEKRDQAARAKQAKVAKKLEKESSAAAISTNADQNDVSKRIWLLLGFGVGAYLPFHFGHLGWIENLIPGAIGAFLGYKLSTFLSWIVVLGLIVIMGVILFMFFSK